MFSIVCVRDVTKDRLRISWKSTEQTLPIDHMVESMENNENVLKAAKYIAAASVYEKNWNDTNIYRPVWLFVQNFRTHYLCLFITDCHIDAVLLQCSRYLRSRLTAHDKPTANKVYSLEEEPAGNSVLCTEAKRQSVRCVCSYVPCVLNLCAGT